MEDNMWLENLILVSSSYSTTTTFLANIILLPILQLLLPSIPPTPNMGASKIEGFNATLLYAQNSKCKIIT